MMDTPVHDVSEPVDGRNGLLVGLDLFAGDGLESDARLAAGLGVRIGWMMSPVLALMLDTHGAAVGSSQILATDVESTVLMRSLAAASVQWWPTQRFWLRGGLGPGRVEGMTAAIGFTPGIEEKETTSGFGATLATGFELYQGPLFALDAHARYTGIRAGGAGYSNLVVGVGFGWYAHVTPTGPQVTKAEPDTWRGRWVLGLDALGGWPINNDCGDCYWSMGAGADFQVGRMITPRLGLMLDTHAVAVGRSAIEGYDDAEAEVNAQVQGVVALAAQYWTSRRTWIKGGFGRGEVRESITLSSPEGSFDITETETGFGLLAAAGYELYQGRSLGAGVHARYAGIYGGNLSRASVVLGLGVAWYP